MDKARISLYRASGNFSVPYLSRLPLNTVSISIYPQSQVSVTVGGMSSFPLVYTLHKYLLMPLSLISPHLAERYIFRSLNVVSSITPFPLSLVITQDSPNLH